MNVACIWIDTCCTAPAVCEVASGVLSKFYGLSQINCSWFSLETSLLPCKSAIGFLSCMNLCCKEATRQTETDLTSTELHIALPMDQQMLSCEEVVFVSSALSSQFFHLPKQHDPPIIWPVCQPVFSSPVLSARITKQLLFRPEEKRS